MNKCVHFICFDKAEALNYKMKEEGKEKSENRII